MTSILRLPLVTLILCLFIVPGCSDPQRGLKTVGSIGIAVERAMTAAGDLHRAGKITDATRDRIIARHDAWLPLYNAALAVAKSFPMSSPSPELREATVKLLDETTAAGVPRPNL